MEAVAATTRWRALPPEVVAEVERRRAELLTRAREPVLDLDDPAARARVAVPLDEADVGGAPAEPRFATIVCTAALIEEADLSRAVRGLAERLADDGELLLVEPVGHPGVWGLLTASAGAALPVVAGLHLSRDVVAAVRAAGLTVADLDRFEIATRVWPLRRFVQLRALRIPRQPASGIDARMPGPVGGAKGTGP